MADVLDTSVQYLKGVGEKRAAYLRKLGIDTLWDLLYYFPREYDDRRQILPICQTVPGQMCCICATPYRQVTEKRIRRNLSVCSLYVDDGTGSLFVKWFTSPQYSKNISYGQSYIFYGKRVDNFGRSELELAAMEKQGANVQTGRIVPVYPLTKGLNQTAVQNLVAQAMDKADKLPDVLPEQLRTRLDLLDLDTAVRTMHAPDSFEALELARRRLVFEELFVLQMSLSFLKHRRGGQEGPVFADIVCADVFLQSLPFTPTNAQKQAVAEICADLQSGRPMNRLVQGDVGSGKTVVAAAAMLTAVKNGYQAALMAPTEILAFQHYDTLRSLLGNTVSIALLTGSSRGKKEILRGIATGGYDIVIGTHALIEKDVEFARLGLCVTDEQHRFGVSQRAKLKEKGGDCHVLVMSATPIPRTLALILYGDLDISIIGELPKGRQPIDTFCVGEAIRQRAYGFVKKQLDEGRQGYVVCPLVEESEKSDLKSGTEFAEKLQRDVLPGYRIGLLHGKMRPAEKDEIMMAFKAGEIDLLVSTTVIEVGVDVPNANIMVIENAERFGLSQLHQLRGRVGRGAYKSYCILFTDSDNEVTRERMNIMCRTNDGFLISQKDLELRGSGEFFGTRQHGLPELKVANLFTDLEVLKQAQAACELVLHSDPQLEKTENSGLRARIAHLFSRSGGADIFN